jgi:hypothetical protein
MIEGIDHSYSSASYVNDVASDERPLMYEGGSDEQAVNEGDVVAYGESTPFLGYVLGHRYDPIVEAMPQLRKPAFEAVSLLGVSPPR